MCPFIESEIIEYLNQFGISLTGCGNNARTVTMVMLRSTEEQARGMVRIDDIIQEHAVELSVLDRETQYRGAKNIVFADREDTEWKYESCDWFIQKNKDKAVHFATLSELLAEAKKLRVWDGNSDHRGAPSNRHRLLYAEDADTYFVLRAEDKQLVADRWPDRPNIYVYMLRPVPLNQLGGRVSDHSDEAEELMLQVAPVRREFTGVYTGTLTDENNEENPAMDYGRMMFLSSKDYHEAGNEMESPVLGMSIKDSIREFNETFSQTEAASRLEEGKKEREAEYYDKLFLGFWNGTIRKAFQNPLPVTARYEANDLLGVTRHAYSLNPADHEDPGAVVYPDIEPGVKVSFKFLADRVPDVRALYLIRGKRYLCGKLKATFSTSGISRLISGEFYPLAGS